MIQVFALMEPAHPELAEGQQQFLTAGKMIVVSKQEDWQLLKSLIKIGRHAADPTLANKFKDKADQLIKLLEANP